MADMRSAAAVGSNLAEGLVRLVAGDISSEVRLRLLKDLAQALLRQSRNVSTLACQGASLLEASVPRLPIRSVEELHDRYGTDTEVAAEQVVAEASRHAGLVWTAAAAVPAPSRVVRLLKVLVHSIIEIRLIGELYSLYGDVNVAHDPGWLGMVTCAWAAGRPVMPSHATSLGANDIAARLRSSYAAMHDRDGRLARLLRRGRDGTESVRRLGWRFRRRMRPDPSMWASPHDRSTPATTRVAGGIASGHPDTLAEAPSGRPFRHLDRAWFYHLRARAIAEAAAAGPGPGQRVVGRLHATLDLQEQHLRWLSMRLERSLPTTHSLAPGVDGAPLALAHSHASLAEDAIDAVESTGRRARHLGGWPVPVRNGLVYLLIAAAVTLPMGLLAGSSVSRGGVTPGGLAMLAMSSCGLPLLGYGLGALATGWLFRPWLDGRTPRSPVIGLAVTATVSVLTLVILPAVAAALW